MFDCGGQRSGTTRGKSTIHLTIGAADFSASPVLALEKRPGGAAGIFAAPPKGSPVASLVHPLL